MRIAQVSPLFESVPPRLYGGTERIVSNLTEALLRLGHEVTLFASGDSVTNAELRAPCDRALRLDPSSKEHNAPHTLMFEMVMQEAHRFDVVHFHTETMHFPLARRMSAPTLTTLHGRLDLLDYPRLFKEFEELPLVSISQAQQEAVPGMNWMGVVHHGLPRELIRYREGGGDYLAFLGRISPEKRVDRAVEIARRSGMKLRVAAKVDPSEQEYAETVWHHLKEPHVEYIGEIGDSQKEEFLGGAAALLFPIDWPEPFGLAMIEALAAGTPVIAWSHGSVPELIRHGVNGFVVSTVQEACEAVRQLETLNREDCRRDFEQRFSSERMAGAYVTMYERLLAERGDCLARPLTAKHDTAIRWQEILN